MTALEAVAVVEEFLEGELEQRKSSMMPPNSSYITEARKAVSAIAVIRKTVEMPAMPVALSRLKMLLADVVIARADEARR